MPGYVTAHARDTVIHVSPLGFGSNSVSDMLSEILGTWILRNWKCNLHGRLENSVDSC